MKKRTLGQKTFKVLVSATLCLPIMTPVQGFGQARVGVMTAPDLFPIDRTPPIVDSSGGGSGGSTPRPTTPPASSSNSNGTSNPVRSNYTPNPGRMNTANVPEEYACPLFDNRPHEELIMAIDSLTREVKISQECADKPAAQAIDQNTKAIRDSVGALQGALAVTDPNAVNLSQIESTVTAAISATQNLGEILNSNSFINSNCGRQTMSSGKALVAFNDILNGLSPYALLAVSMNAALAPALPWVVGGVVATSAISVMGKMIDQNTLDMTRPEHRKAVLANTCQFIKVAKKVRFMQLAQSGRIEKITEELERNMKIYNARFAAPSKELSSLLTLKASVERQLSPFSQQLNEDRIALIDLESQSYGNQDDMMMCVIGKELTQMAKAGQFPQTVFNNLEAIAATSTKASRIQVASLKSLNLSSIKKIEEQSALAENDVNQLKACANSGRSWVAGVKQALAATQNMIAGEKELLERRLNESSEYRSWKSQYTRLQMEELTIKRVEKAMQELAKDNSIIDRSELDQRMTLLKAGLFGRRGSWSLGRPPVLAWLEHTKTAHDRSVSTFLTSMKSLRAAAWSVTPTAMAVVSGKENLTRYPHEYIKRDQLAAADLSSLNLKTLPLGTREHELVCQQLEVAWIDWSASMDHLGATQFFCDLIDGVIDIKMDADIATYCRGARQANGQVLKKSAIDAAKETLVRKGYQKDASLVAERMKQLKCPTPGASVMN